MLFKKEWPKQPRLETTKNVSEKRKPVNEGVLYSVDKESDDWDVLEDRNNYEQRCTRLYGLCKTHLAGSVTEAKEKTELLMTDEINGIGAR